MMMKVQIYEDREKQWRWRAVAANGRIIADSAEGYDSEANVRRALNTVAEFFHAQPPVEVLYLYFAPIPHKASTPEPGTGTTLSG